MEFHSVLSQLICNVEGTTARCTMLPRDHMSREAALHCGLWLFNMRVFATGNIRSKKIMTHKVY